MASFPLDLQQNFHKLAQHWVWGETNSLVSLLEEDMHARGLKQDDPCGPFQHRPFYDSLIILHEESLFLLGSRW